MFGDVETFVCLENDVIAESLNLSVVLRVLHLAVVEALVAAHRLLGPTADLTDLENESLSDTVAATKRMF